MYRTLFLVSSITFFCGSTVLGAGQYHKISYGPSTKPGELQLGVSYTLWLPDGVSQIRGIIVHQHGCGRGACQGGATAAYDLHWQALARKWDCALLGPSYEQDDKQNCRLWCDPRNGSAQTFLRALSELARLAKHPEIATVPWCLWGHSGGGFWASIMQTLEPHRIVAIWFRSGTAYATWEKGEIARPEIKPEIYGIPMMLNPGSKEKGDKRFHGAWTGSLAMFSAYRSQHALIGLAPDPHTAHECGDSRYLAIPFFDACLQLRLPEKGSDTQKLKPIPENSGYRAELLGSKAFAAKEFKGKDTESVWLPNEAVARAWENYVATGAVSDVTPPEPPTNLKISKTEQGHINLSWEAEADFESGIQSFIIERDGKVIAQIPEKQVGRFGRPLFQRMSYHDTPEKPLPEMKYKDMTATPGVKHQYSVRTVNSVRIQSKSSPTISLPE